MTSDELENERQETATFNPDQLKAIKTPTSKNVLITAGAGSGKTFTLAYKVYHLVTYEGIDPSALLVLTFTNKAAFEMKERIIKQFVQHQGKNSRHAEQIVSSHIQTFDSFSMYLVKKYASLLKMPDSITVADDGVLLTKKSQFLDEILHDYYVNEKERVVKIFSKYCTADDNNIKAIVQAIDDELQKLLPEKRKEYINNCVSTFLSDDFLNEEYLEFVRYHKEMMRNIIISGIYALNVENKNIEDRLTLLEDNSYYQIHDDTFKNDKLKNIYNHYQRVLDTSDEDFVFALNELFESEETKGLFDGKKNGTIKKEDPFGYNVFFINVRDEIKDKVLSPLYARFGSDYRQAIKNIQSHKEDIILFFEIINKLNARLDEYKYQTSAYTFSDICYKALSLLTDERYADAAEEIKNRFKYVLVDEYQDTNDVQETFLEKISEKATLFCVGDAKQSIYRFRNSNVQLFMDRKKRYEQNPNQGCVIAMNWNYRSFIELLDNINAIFKSYMTIMHGGIDYREESEDGNHPQQLGYDPHPKFPKAYAKNTFYGLGFIQLSNTSGLIVEEEAKAILFDIQEKIKNHYQIDDRGKLRDCRYLDFAILIRKSSTFAIYQKVFDEYQVPVNIVNKDHLTQINAILLLQSLIKLIAYVLNNDKSEEEKENVPHLFMSVARSYIYGEKAGYDDESLYEILSDKENLYSRIYQDPIMVKIKDFANDHKDAPLSIIFVDLLKEFQVMDKLPMVGEVISNNDKIESFYQIVLSQESIGQGIADFVALFKNISKYNIEISAETSTELDNAVNIMTIHKSKGLEMPIVYMPLHANCLSSDKQTSDVCVSLKRGIILPHYELNEYSTSLLKGEYKAFEGSSAEEINEHIRIFYVALTRAKQALYFVGDPDKKKMSRHKENILNMLDYLFHYTLIDDQHISLLSSLGCYTTDDENTKNEIINNIEKIYGFDKVLSPLGLSAYNVLKNIEERKLAELNAEIISRYNNVLSKEIKDFTADQKARYIAMIVFNNKDIKTSAELLSLYPHISIDDVFDSLPVKKNSTIHEDRLLALIEIKYGLNAPLYNTIYDDKNLQVSKLDISSIQLDKQEKQDQNDVVFNINNDQILFEERKDGRQRASKEILEDEEKAKIKEALDYGTRLHAYLELTDFVSKDTSFIKDMKDRKHIDEVLALPLFADLSNTKIFKEYAYYDSLYESQGFVDCLFVDDDTVTIIDYKTKKIDDEGYNRQLNVYRRNIQPLFPNHKIKMVLLSILDKTTREVEIQDYD